MKKFLALLFMLTLSLSLCACNKSKSTDPLKTANQLSIGKFDTTPTIEESVIYNENDIKITANNLTYTNRSAELKLTFENNTDKDLSFICGSVGYDIISVNEYMADDGYISCDVPAGESASDKMTFDISSLKAYGITCIADITTGFDISDDNYNSIYTGPLQIKTTAADSYDYSQNRYMDIIKSGKFEGEFDCTIDYVSDKTIYNNLDFQISSVAVSTNSDGIPILALEFANNSTERMHFKIKEVHINNNLVYESLWTSNSINSKKKFVEGINLSQLAEKYEGDSNDISTISNISFVFEIGKTFNDTNDSQKISISLPNIKIPSNK